MGLYKYYDPATGTRKPIKAGSIVNMDGTNEVTPDDFVAHKDENASTTTKGHVQLSTSTSSTSTTTASTPSAVKTVNDALIAHQADNATTSQKGHIYIASESEALVGENNTKAMTALRTKQAIDKALEITLDDPSGSPGPAKLMHGSLSAGYFGFVSAGELITGTSLASQVGISQGTSQFSNEGWFKYVYQEKICFVAKKPIRHSISWNNINSAGCVFGTKTITIGGLTYKVRLLTGGNGNPADKAGGEWNIIMYGLHQDQEPNWGVYTDQDLHTHNTFGNGTYSWCQETSKDNDAFRVHRGYSGVTYFNTRPASNATDFYGWRPVLELIS